MKLRTSGAILLMASALGRGESRAVGQDRSVVVCVEGGTAFGLIAQVEKTSSEIFARIGVKLAWHYGLGGCSSDGIQVTFSAQTPVTLKPGALAYSLPYEGTHIRLFSDRISKNYPAHLTAHVMAHVLVHEITHILQGAVRHSDHGIMKAQWEAVEISAMGRNTLDFADEDIDLIHRGLAGRAGKAIALNNVAPITVATQ